MQSLVKVKKIEKWSRIPMKSSESTKGHTFQNAYTTLVPKGSTVTVSSGIKFQDGTSSIALVLGTSPSAKNKNLEIQKSFIGLDQELKTQITNYGDDSVELSPFVHLTDFVLLKVSQGEPNIVDSLDSTARGESGFGSTGLK